MRLLPVAVGGLAAGSIIVAGEAVLNLVFLADEWARIFSRFGLAEPTAGVALQGLLKLMLLGVFCVWLAAAFRPVRALPFHPGVVSGLIVWFLVWAWVQWGMLLAGYVSPVIAAATVAWGFFQLPLAGWVGVRVHDRLAARASTAPSRR